MKHNPLNPIIALILALGFTSTTATADIDGRPIRFDRCPEKVRATIRANTGGGTIESVELLRIGGTNVYIADVEFPGSRDLEIFVRGNGSLLKTREDIPFRKLPAPVRKTVRSFAGSVDDVDKETVNGVVTYQVELDRYGRPDLNLLLSAEGVVLKKSTGEDPFDIDLTVVSAPSLRLEQPAGSALAAGQSRRAFGSVPVGKNGAARAFVVTNNGSAGLEGLSVVTTGPHAADFVVSPMQKSELAPGESGSFTVRFAPTSEGLRSASIRVAANPPGDTAFVINLSGHGVKS
jgi:uncharacterized membrane protein YkoI